jgi:hypothetical protein
LREIAQRFGPLVPPGHNSLWVYPGGYFGFDATTRNWVGFNARVVQEKLAAVLRAYPSGARLAFGADDGDQQVWLSWLNKSGSLVLHRITRGSCSLADREIQVGSIRASFFVCGEFTGSHTKENGPFWENEYLTNPVAQLRNCHLLVDLAHFRVKGGVHGPPGPRLVHHRQMLRFARRGTAVLTHHHAGAQTAGRARDNCQSNWVIFRGGERLDERRVYVMH